MIDIPVVFLGFINQRSHHWGAPSCRRNNFFLSTDFAGWWLVNLQAKNCVGQCHYAAREPSIHRVVFFGTICRSLQVQLPPYLIIYIIQFLAEQFDCSNCRLGPFGNDGTPQPTMMLDYHVLYWHCHKNVGVHQQNLFERPMKPGNFRGGTWTDAARLVLRSFYIQVHIWQNWMTGIYIYTLYIICTTSQQAKDVAK